MPTFNEQKGQGTFQPVLSDPASGVSPGGRTVTSPAASGAAAGLQGVANVLDAFASQPLPPDVESENLVANKADLESQLVGELSLIADAPIPGGTFRAAKSEIEQVGAGYRQGRISPKETNVRLAAIVQRYVAGDPRNAPKYRDLARDVLGFNPTEKVIAQQLENEQFKIDQQREIERDQANYAIERGVVVPDGFGGIDVDATALKGQKLQADQARIDRLEQQIRMNKLRAETNASRKLTQAEIDANEERTFSSAMQPYLDERLQGMYNAIEIYRQGPPPGSTPQEHEVAIRETINQLQASALADISRAAIKAGVRNDILQKELAKYNAAITPITNMLTGDLSNFANQKASLDALGVEDAHRMRLVAPDITLFNNALGPEFTGAIVNATVNSSEELKSRVYSGVSEDVSAMLNAGARAVTGESDTSNMNPQETSDAVKFSLKTVEQFNKQPQANTAGQTQAVGNSLVALTTAALATPNTRDRQNGTLKLSTERNMKMIEQNRNNATFEEAGARLRNLNLQAFAELAPRLQPDTTTPNIVRAGLNRFAGTDLPVTSFVPVYDPAQGRIVMMQTSGSDGALKPLAAPQERSLAQRIARGDDTSSRRPIGLETDIERANAMLNNAVRFADYGGADFSDLSPEQIKELFVRDANIRVLGEE